MILGAVSHKNVLKLKCARRSATVYDRREKEPRVTKRKTSLWVRKHMS